MLVFEKNLEKSRKTRYFLRIFMYLWKYATYMQFMHTVWKLNVWVLILDEINAFITLKNTHNSWKYHFIVKTPVLTPKFQFGPTVPPSLPKWFFILCSFNIIIKETLFPKTISWKVELKYMLKLSKIAIRHCLSDIIFQNHFK